MTTQPLYTAHDVADLFNLLPTLVGFVPEESICAIATSGPRHRFGFRMRVDLPHDDEHVPQVARFVAEHLRNNGAEGAIVLVVSDRVEEAGRAAWAVERSLGSVLPVVTAWTDGQRYWTTFDDDPDEGTPLELSGHHPAVVSAVVAGQEVLPDRAALEARWRPEHGPRQGWFAAQVHEVERDLGRETCAAPQGLVVREGLSEVLTLVERAADGHLPDTRGLLRACVWLTHQGVRERLWPVYDRDDADRVMTAWRELARQAPPAYAAVPYTVAAYLAYLLGDGAQALIGLRQARAADPCYGMAETLQDVLMSGLHPDRLHDVMCGRGPGDPPTERRPAPEPR